MTTILVLDDDSALGGLIHDILTEVGYAVVVTTTTDEALDALAGQAIHLILSDLDFGPYGEGSWQRITRFHATAPHLPIVIVTGHSYAVSDASRYPGTVDVLTKPFEIDALLDLVIRLTPP